MEINSFSKTDRVSGALGSLFKFLFGWVAKIDITTVFITIGLLGWIFGAYMDFPNTAEVFGIILLTTVVVAMIIANNAEDLGLVFTFCFVISGFAGYWVEGNIKTSSVELTEKNYMVNPVLTGKSIEYIGGDNMTKIIKISNEEILAHYKKFKDSGRFAYVQNTTTTKNVILDFIGIDYVIATATWITLHDTKANKDLFRIK